MGRPAGAHLLLRKAHELRPHDRSSLTYETRRARRRRLVAGEHGRVDRLGLVLTQGPLRAPRSMSAILFTPSSLPKPPGRSGQPRLAGARSPQQTDLRSVAPGKADPTQGSVHVSRSAWIRPVSFARTRGEIRPAGKNVSAQVVSPGRRRGRPGSGPPLVLAATLRARSMPLLPEPRTSEPQLRGPCQRSPNRSPSTARPRRRRRARR